MQRGTVGQKKISKNCLTRENCGEYVSIWKEKKSLTRPKFKWDWNKLYWRKVYHAFQYKYELQVTKRKRFYEMQTCHSSEDLSSLEVKMWFKIFQNLSKISLPVNYRRIAWESWALEAVKRSMKLFSQVKSTNVAVFYTRSHVAIRI